MLKRLIFIPFILVLSCSSIAFNEDLDSDYLDNFDRKNLSKLERMNSQKLEAQALMPGLVQFTYGAGIPTIVCAVLEITDIILEEGEEILNVQLGDAARWSVDSMLSGTDTVQTEHLIIKPLDTGLKTSLLIATNKRSYHLRLKSSADDYMPAVSFYYPNQNKILKQKSVRAKTRISSNQNMKSNQSKRNYGYHFDGDNELYPINAYDDGVNTYIQMSKNINLIELPSIMEVFDDGGFFIKDEKLTLVNFRINDNTYIVDGLHEHLRLLSNSSHGELTADIIRNS